MELARCRTCAEHKPPEQMVTNRRNPRGYSLVCRSCDNQRRSEAQRSMTADQREAKAPLNRAKYLRHRPRKIEQKRRARLERPEVTVAYVEKRKASPELTAKQRARWRVTRAVCDGRIIKPEQCQECGDGGRLHGHHEDYSRPLDVCWLCAICHGKAHRKYGEAVPA